MRLNLLAFIRRPPWRTLVPLGLFLVVLGAAYGIWRPGEDVTSGIHDLGSNGMWLQHGWIGADSWFVDNDRVGREAFFHDPDSVEGLASELRANHITQIYPHLCPTDGRGAVMPVNDAQTELFLNKMAGVQVLPWVGGDRDQDVFPRNKRLRKVFAASLTALFRKHPRLAGIQLNVEPWPDGDRDMLSFLDQIRASLPPGAILSVAAYPPPTMFQPSADVHWSRAYYHQVSAHVDLMDVMMYDTSIRLPKVYQYVMSQWTREILIWSQEDPASRHPAILFGVPAYADDGGGYHHPYVENFPDALPGIHAGLSSFPVLPAAYKGLAVYCEWQIQPSDWAYWREHFMRRAGSNT